MAIPGRTEDKCLCALLATNTIDALVAFSEIHMYYETHGYFMTTSIVECIYHLVHFCQLRDPKLANDRTTALKSFQTAYRLLNKLSSHSNSAKRAITVLKENVLIGPTAAGLFLESPPDAGDSNKETTETNDCTWTGAYKPNFQKLPTQTNMKIPDIPSDEFEDVQTTTMTSQVPHPPVSEMLTWDLDDIQWSELEPRMLSFSDFPVIGNQFDISEMDFGEGLG